MKKIFTLLATAVLAMSASAQTYLVAYGVDGEENHGYQISGTTDDDRTVKLNDGTTLTALSFNHNWGKDNDNYIKLTTDGGFKAGDVLEFKGVIANKDESKRGACRVYGSSDVSAEYLYQSDDFVNITLNPTNDLKVYSYTLEEDAEDLYLSRNGGTRTQLVYIAVTRAASTPTIAAPTHDQASDEMTYNDQPIMVIFTPADASHEIYAHFENFPLPSGGMPAVTITPSGSKTLSIDGKTFTLVAPSPMGNVYVVQKGGRLSYVALDPATGIQSEVKSIAFNYPGQSGIADVTVDENAPVEYYNLQGIRIAEPAEGQVVIRRQGNQVSKVVVK